MQPLTAYDRMRAQLIEAYGDAGEFALETSDVTEADCVLGFDHVVEKIAPALEEELMCLGGDKPKAFEE